MTAYELAEKLYLSSMDTYHEEAANMLRQQADQIAELEETIGACYAVQKMQAEEVYKGNDRIAELEKQTKPLSDEEIIKIFNQIWNAGGNTNGVMHRFARAIEERHGIKNV